MNPREARFILRAHRPDGRYPAHDPLFADALAEIDRSPDLARWLEREHALDATVANKLEGIQPPAGLRETILAGARASRLHRPAWRQPRWFALAAAITIVAAIPVVLRFKHAPAINAGAFAHLAMDEYATHRHDHTYGPPLEAIAASLRTRTTPLTAGLNVTSAQLRDANCADLKLGNRDVYEVCFQRDGAWFHLYVTRLDRAGTPERDRQPIFLQQDQFAAAAWTDGTNLYSLVTRAGRDALAKVV